MAGSFDTLRSLVNGVGAVSPRLGGDVALRLFFETRPRMPVRSDDAETHAAAERGTVNVRGLELATYGWGSGEDTVLLVHGWRGRASQFARLVRGLVAAGFRVVAFDAPGHGASPGRHTDIRDWLAAIDGLQRTHGRFHTVVGHSFGALATLTAARSGVDVGSVATLAGAASPMPFLDEFSRGMGLSPATDARFRTAFRRRMGVDEASLIARYDAVADPLPTGIELLALHDDGDRQLSPTESTRLVAAHPGRSRLIRTQGFGHNRILSADLTVGAVTALATGGLAAVDDVANAAA